MTKTKDIYEECGILRNIIDLMTDLTYRGIKISHPQASRQKFYQEWFERVGGVQLAERFCHLAYRAANIAVQRHEGKATVRRGTKTRRISLPIKYNYINPAILDVEDREIGAFTGEFKYVIRFKKELSDKLNDQVLNGKDTIKDNTIPIYNDPKVRLFFFKKDDWDAFAKPFTYPLIKEVVQLNKLDLAERTALDSAINHVRIFTMGDIPTKLAPAEGSFDKLSRILEANNGSGCTNIMWGPDLKLQESDSNFYRFLGMEKYQPTLQKIYQGSGIPVMGSGAANSDHLSLSVLTERLQYCRKLLNTFLYGELENIRKALGDTKGAEIEYDLPTFSDETAHRALLIQMADRGLISDELIQSLFHHNVNMEEARIKREEKERDGGKRSRRLGPFIENDFEKSLLKILMTQNLVSPESLSDKFKKLQDFEFEDPMEQERKRAEINQPEPGGQPQQGRPKNSKDKEKRQRRSFKPTKADLAIEFWACKAHDKIVDVIKPHVLTSVSKASIRELTTQEFKDYEELKAGILFNLEYGDFSDDAIAAAIQKPLNQEKVQLYKTAIAEIAQDLDRELTTNERQRTQAFIYANA